MFRQFFIILVLSSSLVLTACHSENKTAPTKKTFTVTKKPTYSMLYFAGNLQPLKQVSMTAPTDGIIVAKGFTYGQNVKKGELLFTLRSSKIRKDFESALTAYLKAKEDFNHQVSSYQNTANLYKSQLVSRDEYTQAKNAFYLSQLSLLQAHTNLARLAQFFPAQKNTIFSLSIEDIKNITKTFSSKKTNSNVKIKAIASGIALFPEKSSSSDQSGDNSKKVTVGSAVKQGQLLVTIGESKGLSLSAKANEININQLSTGLKAEITSVAFPGITLHGYIASIDNQASSSGPIPQFNLEIYIDNIPEAAKKLIRIGMSAKASVRIQRPATIQIPIKAVTFNSKTNQASVQLLDDKTGKTKQQIIRTGKTSLDSVIVTSGLKLGDKIVY